MNIPKIESVWQEMKIKPVVNECELHPHLRQDELIAYLKEKNVLPIAHTPLGSPHRPERDRTTEDTNCLQDPAILEIAQAHGIHPVSVVLKWAVQRGTLPVPFSISRSHILSNLRCCTEDLLTNAEMERLTISEPSVALSKELSFCGKVHLTGIACGMNKGRLTVPDGKVKPSFD